MHTTLLLDMAAAAAPDRLALGALAGGISFAELKARATAAASWLSEFGGETVVFVGLNGPAMPIAVFAAGLLGKPFAPLNYRLPDVDLNKLLARTAPSVAIRAALAILDHIEGQGLLGKDGKIMRLSRHFTGRLQDLARRRPDLAAGPFGLGGMICFTPLGGNPDLVAKYLKNLFEAGVIGFIAGGTPAKARFLLPVGGIEEADIDAAFPILERVLAETKGGA